MVVDDIVNDKIYFGVNVFRAETRSVDIKMKVYITECSLP